jgi:hypothetical protein
MRQAERVVESEPLPLTAKPGERVRAACRRWGERDVVQRCVFLLSGRRAEEEPELLPYLGGPHAVAMATRGLPYVYWPRVWAARALTYAWDPLANPAVTRAIGDDSWRVREMAAKVVALREIGAAAEPLLGLLDDPIPRVRAAAARAVGAVGEAEHAHALQDLRDDPERDVRYRAEQALVRLSVRLDRDLRSD